MMLQSNVRIGNDVIGSIPLRRGRAGNVIFTSLMQLTGNVMYTCVYNIGRPYIEATML